MEKKIIEQSSFVPEITLDPDQGLIEFSGKSYPENTFEVYEPVINWLKEYFDGNARERTVVNVEIPYFNSSSSKVLYDIFSLLNDATIDGNNIEVNWIYDKEDDSTEEDGMDFREDFDELMFNLIPKEID